MHIGLERQDRHTGLGLLLRLKLVAGSGALGSSGLGMLLAASLVASLAFSFVCSALSLAAPNEKAGALSASALLASAFGEGALRSSIGAAVDGARSCNSIAAMSQGLAWMKCMTNTGAPYTLYDARGDSKSHVSGPEVKARAAACLAVSHSEEGCKAKAVTPCWPLP